MLDRPCFYAKVKDKWSDETAQGGFHQTTCHFFVTKLLLVLSLFESVFKQMVFKLNIFYFKLTQFLVILINICDVLQINMHFSLKPNIYSSFNCSSSQGV